MQEDIFTNTLFTLPLPPLTSLKEKAVLFKAELSPPLSPLLYTNFLKSDNKFIAIKTPYHSYTLGTPT